jgi:hypothetical protein
LENGPKKVPMIGKNNEKSSNGWKKRPNSFQRLENPRLFLPTTACPPLMNTGSLIYTACIMSRTRLTNLQAGKT